MAAEVLADALAFQDDDVRDDIAFVTLRVPTA
jgi:hypothetical protein